MEMILGIVIGLVIWQFVIFVLNWLQMEDTPWSCPIPYLCLLLVEFIILCWEGCLDIKVMIYYISIGKNPFKTSVRELASLEDKHKQKMLELSTPKHKKQLEKVFGYYDRYPQMKNEVSEEVKKELEKLPRF